MCFINYSCLQGHRGSQLAYEHLGILGTSFVLNIIPFAGPSNLFIASNAAIAATGVDPLTIGVLVALGSASAKFTHYLVTFYAGRHIGEKRRKRLDAEGIKLKRWAFLALFIVAASPLPDEPVIIPLGLLRYNPAKLFLAYFSGKLIIATVGAYLGRLTHERFVSTVSNEVLIAISIVVTLVITAILLKVDVGKVTERILGRNKKTGERVEGGRPQSKCSHIRVTVSKSQSS